MHVSEAPFQNEMHECVKCLGQSLAHRKHSMLLCHVSIFEEAAISINLIDENLNETVLAQ